ncbi:hypothetical protein [Streptomyces sp. NBC_01565]|uniref:hypothetical protein n=1 Tax=unclassified Streptomyces TaxID=2593676 RepID=UPI0022510186|nr:hypothetical protein [Streptomyces sp. NBC_01565]MCX4546918.1 hypothetical protein [Streptomyces sp. NBC_01565]
MPGKDEVSADKSEDSEPPPRGEGRTARDVLLAVFTAVLADYADEAAHWVIQFVVWLYEIIVSRL